MNKQVINAGEIVANSVNVIMMKANTNWYWEDNGNKYSVIIATRTIVHPCLDVATIKYVADLPHSLCNKKHAKDLLKCIQFLSLIKVMTIFYMKLIGKIKLSTKKLLMM